jgi:hypothetical protein
MKKIALVLALLFVVSVSRADQLYAVNGSLTIVGDDVCSGLCVETINFSFELDEYVAFPNGPDGASFYFLSVVPGSSSVTSFGPLGTFDGPEYFYGVFPGVGYPGSPSSNYTEFLSALAEIDIWAAQDGVSTPFVPEITGGDLYTCDTAECVADFCVPGISFVCTPGSSSALGMDTPGVAEAVVTPISIPEPGTLPLLGIAFSALFLLRMRSVCSRVSSLKFLQ